MKSPLPGLIVLVLTVSMHAGVVHAATSRQLARRLDGFMQQQVEERQFSGAVLVVRDGRVLLEKGYGLANREWNQPISSDTKFRTGSLTKQFTATLILQLREQKRLDTGESICKFLKPCPEPWNAVTLHHLLSHTSGIAESPEGPLKFVLYRWDQALYSTRVLSQASLDLMWTEVKANYGYGWMVSRHTPGAPKTAWWAADGRFELAHTGAIQGFTSEFLRFPNERVTVIVLANLQDAPLIGPFLAGIVFDQPFSLPTRR